MTTWTIAFPESSEMTQKATLNIIDNDKSFLSQSLIKELEGEKYEVELLENG